MRETATFLFHVRIKISDDSNVGNVLDGGDGSAESTFAAGEQVSEPAGASNAQSEQGSNG